MDTVWICPSRGRPESIRRLIGAWEETGAKSLLIVYVDEDDEAFDEYREILFGETCEFSPMVSVDFVSGPRKRLIPTVNELATGFATHFDAVGFLGDDHVPRTVGWDTTLANSIEEGGLAYGNDLLQKEKLPTAVLISSDIILELGYFAPPSLVHLYADDAWKAWGEGLGRFYYHPDVIIEHLHFSAGKSDSDSLYEEVNSPKMYTDDGKAFHEYMQTQYSVDIAKLESLYA